MEIKATSSTVEILEGSKRIAIHQRHFRNPGRHTTISKHMPQAHRAHAEWTPERILQCTEDSGQHVVILCRRIIEGRRPISSQLKELRLAGMHKAYEAQGLSSSYMDMCLEDHLNFLLQREVTERENRALQCRLTKAKFKGTGVLEEVQPSASRGLDKTLITQLGQYDWIKDKRNIIITGPSESGKTFLATALSRKACHLGYSARYFRTTNLLAELESTREEGNLIRSVTNHGRPQARPNH